MFLEMVDFVECLLNLAACLRDRLEDLIDPDSLSVSGVPTGVRKGEPGCKKTLDWAREGALRRPPGLLGAPEIKNRFWGRFAGCRSIMFVKKRRV